MRNMFCDREVQQTAARTCSYSSSVASQIVHFVAAPIYRPFERRLFAGGRFHRELGQAPSENARVPENHKYEKKGAKIHRKE